MFEVEVIYEDLNEKKISYGSTIKAFVNLRRKLLDYLISKDGQRARENKDSIVTIIEKLHDGSKVETRMRTRDLYIRQVKVYDSNQNIIIEEVEDGKIGGYNRDTHF